MATLWSATLWTDDIQTVEHQDLGAARLIRQYRGERPRLQGALASFLLGVQSLEDVSMQVLTQRWPLTAIGVQLDTLGKLVGQERGERSDAEYRLWILARILVNKGNGRAEELIHILDTLGAESIIVTEGTSEIMIDVTNMDDGDQVQELMSEAKAGGVRLIWVWNEELEAAAFQTSATLGAGDTDAATGFGDIGAPPIANFTTGGYISGGIGK